MSNDLHSWDDLFLREIAARSDGAWPGDLSAGLPDGITDEWLGDAVARGLIAREDERVRLTARGQAAYEALPADTNRLTIGLPRDSDGNTTGLRRRLRRR